MKLKSNIFIFIFCFTCWICPLEVHAVDEDANSIDDKTEEDIKNEMLDGISLDEINKIWNEFNADYGTFFSERPTRNIAELIKDEGVISIRSIGVGVIHYLFYEVTNQAKLLGTLLMLTLFSIILQAISTAFEQSSVSQVANFIVFIVLIYVTIASFHDVFTYAQETIEQMSHFMMALLPLMLGLLATFGQAMSVTFFHPVIIFLIHVSGLLMTSFIFPLLFLSALLTIISYLNEKYQATYLAELLKSISIGTLGVFITIFLGVISVQGTATAIQDGIALKTTKFITGNFIPVIGGSFTDAADTVLASLLLLKNTIGIVGLIIITSIAAFPAVKIMIIAFMYKGAAALLQPLGKNLIIECLHVVSKYIMYVLACVITATFMFFLAVVFMIIASNIPFLLR